MKHKRKLPGILIYLLILFFSITSLVYALNTTNNQQQIKEEGGETKSDDGVTISKTISKTNKENFFDITLTVETNSEIKNITTYPDMAVVIVMDISNTMNTSLEKDSETSRYDGAVAASELFINKFKEESDKSNALREIGFVAFNTDAHEIFELQECSSADCKDDNQNKSLVNVMKDDTRSIIKAPGYSDSYSRYTNIEGGLKMAHDMLDNSSASNKFIIFVSDGMPTTYLKSTTTYKGYEPHSDGKVGSAEGVFGYTPKNWGCNYGTSYSDRGAIKARIEAQSIKNDNIDIMVVGTGINSENFDTIQDYLDHEGGNKKEFSVVDSEVDGSPGNEFEIGSATDKLSYVNWLTTKIATNNQYYNSDDSSLSNVFNQIFATIQEQLQTSTEASWVANDPMGALVGNEKIEFIGFYDDTYQVENSNNTLFNELINTSDEDNQTDTAKFNSSSSVIDWDLKNSTPKSTRKETTANGEITYYKYILRYRVRLKNELNNFIENNEYKTNGHTTLAYAVLNDEGILTEKEPLVFKEPSVKGYLGEFSFTKYSSYDNRPLEGAVFKLVHDPNCTRHNGYINLDGEVEIADKTATSDENGLVTFTNIPSGHDYILKEVEVPADHKKADDVNITVAYDNVYGAPGDNGLVNILKKGSLSITKKVEGNKEYSGTFEFELTILFDGESLKDGPYKYVITDSNGKEIDYGEKNYSSKTIISLIDGQTYTIKNLPVGATYTLKETTTNGYKVQYQINEGDVKTGEKATCNSSNSCRIENGSNNTVLFINTAGYILPATGKSGMLILIIIASLLIIGPIIDIGYMFYKYRKEDKLTS